MLTQYVHTHLCECECQGRYIIYEPKHINAKLRYAFSSSRVCLILDKLVFIFKIVT